MADGSSGGLSGVLFEAGKTISDAGKQQAQQTAQSVFSSVTGSQKQLFQKPQSGSFTPKSQGQGQKVDPFGNLGKMFESGGLKQPFGAKKPAIPSAPQISQEELARMAAENQARDAEEIAKREQELRQIQAQKAQAHKQLHDEVYYNRIKNIGIGTMEQTRQEKAQETQEEEAAKAQEEQAKQMEVLPGNLISGQQLGQPVSQKQDVAVFQSKTKTEIGRGTTG